MLCAGCGSLPRERQTDVGRMRAPCCLSRASARASIAPCTPATATLCVSRHPTHGHGMPPSCVPSPSARAAPFRMRSTSRRATCCTQSTAQRRCQTTRSPAKRRVRTAVSRCGRRRLRRNEKARPQCTYEKRCETHLERLDPIEAYHGRMEVDMRRSVGLQIATSRSACTLEGSDPCVEARSPLR